MNPACKILHSCFHTGETGEQVLNEGCTCSTHAKKSVTEIMNELIDAIVMDGACDGRVAERTEGGIRCHVEQLRVLGGIQDREPERILSV